MSENTSPVFSDVGIVDVEFGRNVKIIRPVNLYGCTISDDVFIGPFVEIQKNVVVGRRTRVQSHTMVCELTTIGEECFIGHGVFFINDPFKEGRPAGRDPKKWRPTEIGNRVSIGSNATILPVRIGDGVVIGAGAVVTTDLIVPGIYAGNPARLLRKL
jgi:acetyltransferase-like isoleucine patch superfamily enzyme